MPKTPIDLDLILAGVLKEFENILGPDIEKKATGMSGGRIRPEGQSTTSYHSASSTHTLSPDELSLVDSNGKVVGTLSKDFVLKELLNKQ